MANGGWTASEQQIRCRYRPQPRWRRQRRANADANAANDCIGAGAGSGRQPEWHPDSWQRQRAARAVGTECSACRRGGWGVTGAAASARGQGCSAALHDVHKLSIHNGTIHNGTIHNGNPCWRQRGVCHGIACLLACFCVCVSYFRILT